MCVSKTAATPPETMDVLYNLKRGKASSKYDSKPKCQWEGLIHSAKCKSENSTWKKHHKKSKDKYLYPKV